MKLCSDEDWRLHLNTCRARALEVSDGSTARRGWKDFQPGSGLLESALGEMETQGLRTYIEMMIDGESYSLVVVGRGVAIAAPPQQTFKL